MPKTRTSEGATKKPTHCCAACGRSGRVEVGDLFKLLVPVLWQSPAMNTPVFARAGAAICSSHAPNCRPTRDAVGLVERRKVAGSTAAELADEVGISSSYFRDLEYGHKPGSLRTYVRWLLVLERSSTAAAA